MVTSAARSKAGSRAGAFHPVLDGAIAIALAAAYVALLLATAGTLGYARDEGFYFQAATSYARWFEQLARSFDLAISRKAVDAAWAANHEHPALLKSLFALSHLVLHEKLRLFSMEGTSFRFPGMLVSSGAIALVYLWGARVRGRIAGLAAAVLLGAMPRFFYQAHLACFDAAVTTMWMLCAYAYYRTLEAGGAARALWTGVCFGLALDTKHNAWFLPFALGAHAAGMHVAAFATGRPRRETRRRAIAALACMAALGPLVFWALWPWIWRDTFARLREYVSFHVHHEYYNMEFLGRNYWTPPMPRGYAPLMTVATVPTVTLVLAALGLAHAARARLLPVAGALAAKLGAEGERVERWARRARAPLRDAGSPELLWFLGAAVAFAPWLSTRTPIFGGTKHWMTAYPFLALFAGVAFDRLVQKARAVLARPRLFEAAIGPRPAEAANGREPDVDEGDVGAMRRRQLARGSLLPIGLGAIVAAAPVVETARSHPWGLSSYTPLVGGAAGAATLGLNRTFWGYTTGAVVDYLNENVPRGGTVYVHDTAGAAWDMLIRDGRLRRDIRGVWSIAGADFGLYHHEMHMAGQEYQNWVAFGTTAPAHVAGLDGVPVILVYRRPGR